MNFGGDEVVYNYQESAIVILPVPYDADKHMDERS